MKHILFIHTVWFELVWTSLQNQSIQRYFTDSKSRFQFKIQYFYFNYIWKTSGIGYLKYLFNIQCVMRWAIWYHMYSLKNVKNVN